jgi:hypothetical protein
MLPASHSGLAEHIEKAGYPNTPEFGREFLFSVAGSSHLLQHPNSRGVGPEITLLEHPGVLLEYYNNF